MKHRNPLKVLGSVFVFAISIPFYSSSDAQVVSSAPLNVERRGHSATLLQDGRILIVGGENAGGPVSQPELFDPGSQTFSVLASATPRTDHTSTLLGDGRVLIAGGRDGVSSLDSAEIFNPADDTFSPAASPLRRARAGHTATVLGDGKILLVGGNADGSAEIYDPDAQLSSLVSQLTEARTLHGAALLQDGRVLIAGGVIPGNSAVALDSAEIYDPQTQTFSPTATPMEIERALPLLRLLPDGKVQIIGGDAEWSLEIFDPQTGGFNAFAFLPPTPELLEATLKTASRAALISTTIAQNPTLSGLLSAETLALLDRADQTITELPQSNQALVAGGVNSGGQVLGSAALVKSSSAKITTDKTDYAPGEIVTITGTGWLPGEQVAISLHEKPDEYADPAYVVTADAQGNFVFDDFAPQEIDVGRTFILTAIGRASGFTAQTTFQDNKNLTITFAGTGGGSVTFSGITGSPAPTTNPCTATCVNALNNNATGTLTVAANAGSVFAGWSGASFPSGTTTCASTTSPCTFSLGGDTGALTATFNAANTATTTSVSSSTNPSTYGQSVSFTATVSPTTGTTAPTGTVQFKIDGTDFGSPVALSPSGSDGVATSGSISTLTVTGSPHTIQAVYTPTGTFTTSTGTLSGGQTVNKATPTATLAVNNSPQTYNGSPKAATVAISVSSVPGAVANISTGGAATQTNAGTYAVTADFVPTDTANYNSLLGLSAGNFVIDKATPTATLAVNNSPQTYNGSPKAATVAISVSSVPGAVANILTGGAATQTNAGTYAVTADFVPTDTANYNSLLGLSAGNFVIQKASQAITGFTPASPITYSPGGTFPLSATGGASGNPVTFASTTTGVCTVSGSTVTIISAGTCSLTANQAGNDNYYAAPQVSVNVLINPRYALVRYIGQTSFVTSGTSSTTAQVTLSASVQDPTGLALVGAKVDFIDESNNKVLASGVNVSPVANSSGNTGTANTIVTLSTGQFGAESYVILVKMTGNYNNNGQALPDKTATVVVSKPAATNETIGAGTITGLATAAGTYRGSGAAVTYTVGMKYNKSGANLQGKITVSIIQADGSIVYVKSNSISSMKVTTTSGVKQSTIYTKATVDKLLPDGTTVNIDSGVTLRMDSVDAAADQVGFTVLSSKTSEIYYSNQWVLDAGANAWKTVPEAINLPGSCLKIN